MKDHLNILIKHIQCYAYLDKKIILLVIFIISCNYSGFGINLENDRYADYAELEQHLDFVEGNDKVDLYAGIMLGDNIAKNTYTTTDPHRDPYYTHVSTQSYGGIIFSAFGGCRYRFNDRFGVFGELGFGVAVLNLGLNIKI